MSVIEEYAALEHEFRQQVEDDKQHSIDSSFLSNLAPQDSVDFVLVAMEPSTGVPQKTSEPCAASLQQPKTPINFSWSTEDFIFDFCVRKYLCQDTQTYHLTDLAKGAMTTKTASDKKARQKKYERWYPLLQKELSLVAKEQSKTRIIAIGKVVQDFLKPKFLCQSITRVLHYAPTASGHRRKAIESWKEHFPEFSQSINYDEFEATIKKVLKQAYSRQLSDALWTHGLSGGQRNIGTWISQRGPNPERC